MVIELIRHYKVNHKWKKLCSSKEFLSECNKYDLSEIKSCSDKRETESPIYVSSLKRSQVTAKSLFPNSEFIISDLLNEITIIPFTHTKKKLPIWLWVLFGRMQWGFNSPSQLETQSDTKLKMKELLDLIEKENSDCILVGHGFFFYVFSRFLEKRNYSRTGQRKLENGMSSLFAKPN